MLRVFVSRSDGDDDDVSEEGLSEWDDDADSDIAQLEVSSRHSRRSIVHEL